MWAHLHHAAIVLPLLLRLDGPVLEVKEDRALSHPHVLGGVASISLFERSERCDSNSITLRAALSNGADPTIDGSTTSSKYPQNRNTFLS